MTHLNEHRPIRRLGATRRQLLETVDRPSLRSLPAEPYEFSEWRTCRVGIDYHVEVAAHYYSVPHRFIRAEVDARMTVRTVEIFLKGERIAAHVRASGNHKHTTVSEHMPSSHVLVHFSTLMTSRPDLVFPDDMRQAMGLTGIPLAFSTIQPGDTNPFGGGRGGAEGSIGIIVDVGSATVIHSVSPSDSGSSEIGSLGLPPTEENCAASIDQRTTSNEWHVQDYVPVGIFILPPIVIRQVAIVMGEPIAGEVELNLQTAVAPFADQRIFSANARTFLEFDRPSGQWRAVLYDEIIPL